MYEVLKIKLACVFHFSVVFLLKMGINPNNVLRLLSTSLEGLHFQESEINDAEVQLKKTPLAPHYNADH